MVNIFSNIGKPMEMIGTYIGKNTAALRSGHEYKFNMQIQPTTGYWEVLFQEPNITGCFSCIDALYENFIHLKMIMPDGHIVAF